MQLDKHEIYFSRKDFRKIRQQFEEATHKKYTSKELLLIAKAYFIEESYRKCLDVLEKVDHQNQAKILFEKQTLLFKATYLENFQSKNKLITIVDIFDRERIKVTDKPFQKYHLEVFNKFQDFIKSELPDKISKLSNIVETQQSAKELKALRIQIKTKEKQFEREQKFQGFPCFLVSNHWRVMQQEHIYDPKKEHPGPITNFSIINHIFQVIPYQEKSKEYLNTILFPGEDYQVVTKRHWLYLMNLYSGVPVRRVYVSAEKFTNQVRYGDSTIVKLCILYKNQVGVIQCPSHSLWPNGIIPYIWQRYGTGQLKEQVSENNFVLVGDGRVFQPEKQQPLKYVTFSQNNIHNLTNQDRKFRNRMFYRYDFERYSFKPNSFSMGTIGITNQNLDCFMNSSIQCLSNTHELTEMFMNNDYLQFVDYSKANRKGSKGEVVCAFADIVKKLWTHKPRTKINKGNGEISPSLFKTAFLKRFESFSGNEQEDAHQFLNFLLNCMHEDINMENIDSLFRSEAHILKDTTDFSEVKKLFIKTYESNNESKITQLFKTSTYSSLHCLKCHTVYYNFDMHLTLSLPLPPDNPYINIMYLSGDMPEEPIKLRVFINNMETVFDIKEEVRKKKQSKDRNEFYLFAIHKRTWQFEDMYEDIVEIETLLLLQSKFYLFLYQVEMSMDGNNQRVHFGSGENIVSHRPLQKDSEVVQDDLGIDDDTVAMPKTYLTLIEYKFNNERRGYPRLVLFNPKSTESERDRLGYESLSDQALNVNGGLATEKEKKQVLQKTKVEKVKGKPYEYVLKVYLKKKLYLFKESDTIQNVGDIKKDVIFNIETCFGIFSQKEKLSLEDNWKCQKCKKVCHAEKQDKIHSVSSHVIVVLKRFNEGEKIYTKIDYPLLNLDLKPYISDELLKQNSDEKAFLYDLYGVTVHRGDLNRGHYYSYCKNYMTKSWFLYDDELVREEVNLEDTVINQNAYILYYQRKS